MAKTLFTYTGFDQLKLDRDDRSCYCSFKIFWKETGEQLAEIITNRSLEGRWIGTENGFKQVAGTCQYRLPGTLQGIRKALRTLAAEHIGLMIDLVAMTEPENASRRAELEKIFEALR